MSDSLVTTDRLDELVARCVELIEQHGEEALAEFCREQPADAEAVRGRIELLRSAGLLGGGSEAVPERLGDFRLVRRLGSGGMGVVYLAVQEPLGRFVALKLVRPSQLYFPGTRERFRREIEAAARLQHEGIVAVHTVGEALGIPYYAMEFVPGCTLAAALRELPGRDPSRRRGEDLEAVVARHAPARDAGPAPWSGDWIETSLQIGVQLADALAHAHQRGIVHRDVKPSNVLLTPRGAARLADFGLAKVDDAAGLSRTGQRLGTPHYMSPEQVSGGKGVVDARSDVYSLGVVLYELLTQRVPFPGDSAEDVYRSILTRSFPAPRRLNGDVDRDLEAVVLKCLEHDPADRYADAAALASDLRRRQRGEPTLARPVPALLRRVRSVGRWSAPALLMLALALVSGWVALDAWLADRASALGWWHRVRLGLLVVPMLLLGWLLTQLARKTLRRRPAFWSGHGAALLLALGAAASILGQYREQLHARELTALAQTFLVASREALRQLDDFTARWSDDLGSGDHELAARVLLENGRPGAAAEHVQRLAQLQPERPAVHALLLGVHEALGQSDAAAREQAWLTEHPFSTLPWEALLDLGSVLAEAGHPDQAIEAYREAGRLRGVDRDRLNRLMAKALMDQCRWDDASAFLEPVLLWQPQLGANAALAVRLATARGDWATADEYLARLEGASETLRFEERLLCLLARGDEAAAWSLAESAAVEHADDASVLERVARQAFQSGRLELARSAYERLLALAQHRSDQRVPAVLGHVGLAAVSLRLGQLDAAEEHARAAVAADPGYYEAHFNLAEARLRRALAAAAARGEAPPLQCWRDYAADLRAALACNALQPQALNNLAFALGCVHAADPSAASLDEATDFVRRAIALLAGSPGSVCQAAPREQQLLSAAWDTLAGLSEAAGNGAAAVEAAQAAVSTLPAGDAAHAARAANLERLRTALGTQPTPPSGS